VTGRKAVFGHRETWYSEESKWKTWLVSGFNTLTEAQKLCFWLVYLPPRETIPTENLFFFSSKLKTEKCLLEKIAQKNCGFSSTHPCHRVHCSQLWIHPLVWLKIRTVNFSFLLFLIPDKGVKMVAVKSPRRRPINGTHTAAIGWYKYQLHHPGWVSLAAS
jgi:hypothetical protein